MSDEKALTTETALAAWPEQGDAPALQKAWQQAMAGLKQKILVLDDDPTGTQTVHDLPVYTRWDADALAEIRDSEERLAYILTNSRALASADTRELHAGLAENLLKVFFEQGQKPLLVSRGDSTLRGHYPLEPATLQEVLSKTVRVDGEIICPFFFEGGRFTLEDIHYVKEGWQLTPAAQTEFAGDAVFGYQSSNLKEWVEEKTGGAVKAHQVASVPLAELKAGQVEKVQQRLEALRGFAKLVVNATSYRDLEVFATALAGALAKGRYFLFRSAASLVRVLAGLSGRPLLAGAELAGPAGCQGPGLVVVGSYVGKTSRQVDALAGLDKMSRVEFRVRNVVDDQGLADEIAQAIEQVEKELARGNDVCLATSRGYWQPIGGGGEKDLNFSARVSRGLYSTVAGLGSRPGFLIAKGGITSSDVAVKGLGVNKAMVMGQILPGVPVWSLGPESRLPGLPYVVFPGNVGDDRAVLTAVEKLRAARG